MSGLPAWASTRPWVGRIFQVEHLSAIRLFSGNRCEQFFVLLNQPDETLKQYNLALPANIELKSVEDCMHAPNCIPVTVKEAGSLCVRADNAAEC